MSSLANVVPWQVMSLRAVVEPCRRLVLFGRVLWHTRDRVTRLEEEVAELRDRLQRMEVQPGPRGLIRCTACGRGFLTLVEADPSSTAPRPRRLRCPVCGHEPSGSGNGSPRAH